MKFFALAMIVAGTALGAAPASMPALPSGHPPIPSKAAAATAPATATGQLTIRAIQGTKGEPIPADRPVTVHFYTKERELKHVDAKLDGAGVAVIGGLELTPEPVQAQIIIPMGDVQYQTLSPEMSSAAPTAIVELKVYGTTRQQPRWRVQMRHVMLSHDEDGVHVREMLSVENPGDRAWVAASDDNAKPGATLVLRLPNDAMGVEIGDGFSPDSVRFENQTLYHVAPLTPGISQYRFSYIVPVKDGQAVLPIVSPVDTQQMMVFVPEGGAKVQATGLQESGTMGEQNQMRLYQAAALPAGKAVTLTLSGLPDTALRQTSGLSTIQKIAVGGIGLVVLGGAAFILLKPKPQKQGA